jgi:hypothetical protein|nr:MAG TPA: hypothetical protein [Caudoviricetes sp.]
MDVLMKHAPALERSLLPKDRQFPLCKTGGVLYGVSIRMICWEKVEDMSEAVVSGALPGRMTPAYAEKYVRKYLSEADAENNRVRIIGGELKEWIDALKMAKAVSTKVAIIAAGGKRMNIFSIREKNRYFRCSVPGVTDANIHFEFYAAQLLAAMTFLNALKPGLDPITLHFGKALAPLAVDTAKGGFILTPLKMPEDAIRTEC